MLSVVSSIFDRLGLITPLLMPATKILQEMCRQKSDGMINQWECLGEIG